MVAISRRFAALEKQLLLLGEVAQEFGCRPSELLSRSPRDLQIDLACAVLLWREREKAGTRDSGFGNDGAEGAHIPEPRKPNPEDRGNYEHNG